MIKREITVTINPYDIGYAFARADSKTQAEVLYCIASELQHVHSKNYSPYASPFCFQADAISKERALWGYPPKRDYLIQVLEDLLEHIKAQKEEKQNAKNNSDD